MATHSSAPLIGLCILVGACTTEPAGLVSPDVAEVTPAGPEDAGVEPGDAEVLGGAHADAPHHDAWSTGDGASDVADVSDTPDASDVTDVLDTSSVPDTPGDPDTPSTSDTPLDQGDAGPALDDAAAVVAACELSSPPALGSTESWSTDFTVPEGTTCSAQVTLSEATIWEVTVVGDATLTLEVPLETEPGWRRPTLTEPGEHLVEISNPTDEPVDVTLTLAGHGAPPSTVEADRSLVWLTAPMTEGTSLAQLMAVVAEDGHGGELLQAWFERFATTAHSERLGPLLLLQAQEAILGPDPSTWDLSLVPFHVTGIHNRIDLLDGMHCGEFRVSLASHDPVYEPLHLLFLFHQLPQPDDVSPAGTLHCTGTALRWARLSELEGGAFEDAALAWIASSLVPEAFGLIETVEFIVSPWEWRQWFLEDGVLDNRPLFQTIDIPSLNAPGPLREAFLAWVAEEAEALANRQAVIPEAYRSASARAAQGIPWVPLDLTGLDEALLEAWPDLRQQIELVGCPACHTADAEFVQTHDDGTLSGFYTKELDARGEHLEGHWSGGSPPAPFGPLQLEPVGHP